jgi:trigger factor
VQPTIELQSVTGVEIKRQPTEATDDDVQRALEQLAHQKRKLTVVDAEIGAGDFVRVDMTFKHQDNEVLTRQGVQINTQIAIAGTDAEEFATKLIGRHKGESVVIPLTFPETFEKEAVRGQGGEVALTIHEISKVVAPALDDEFAKQHDYESMAAMRTTLRERISAEKERLETQRQEEEILDALLKENTFEIPQRLVDQQSTHQLEDFADRLRKEKISEEEIEKKVAESKTESETEAERRVRTFFLVQAIGKKQKIFVTESDLEAELKAIATRHQTTYEQVRSTYEENNSLADLRFSLLDRKVRESLRAKAKFTDN